MSARMPGHLGDWLSPLADGQLPPAQAERAFAHVAVCRACAAGLADEREARQALAGAADVAVAPDLADRLLALSASVPPTAGDPLRDRPSGSWPVGGSGTAVLTASLSGDLAAVARRRRVRRVLSVSLGGIGVVTVVLFSIGGAPVVIPDPASVEALTLLSRTGADAGAADGGQFATAVATSRDTAGAQDGAALAWIAAQGWAQPVALPEGLDVWKLRLVGEHADVLEIDLGGTAGHLVAREQRGRLDTTATAGRTERLGGREVTVLSTMPWHVAWQSGDVVVDVAADVPKDVLEAVLAGFPEGGHAAAGVLPRIGRGWGLVCSAVVGSARG